MTRTWLLARLAGHLDCTRARIDEALELNSENLIAALGGAGADQVRSELAALDIDDFRARAKVAGVLTVCRCDPNYPPDLLALRAPPAVLHVAGDAGRLALLLERERVAIVGSRSCTPYGAEIARSLGRALTAAGVTVVSGMALGIDAAAHAGALEAGGTVAVLPGCASRAYPASHRGLHRQIRTNGLVVSELPPGVGIRRWMFPARNRIIAALATVTVVVEAGRRSGSLITAAIAGGLGREVGAVPGRVTSPQARGTNDLLAKGARVVRGPEDVLEALFGGDLPAGTERLLRPPLEPEHARLLEALAEGAETGAAIARAGLDAGAGLAALAELELEGHVRRGAGGRYLVVCG